MAQPHQRGFLSWLIQQDWKYLVGILIGVAGVAVPLWQDESSSRSIEALLVSSGPLQSKALATVPDVQVLVGGVVAISPFLSTIRLTNNGSKPILASDFESPIEFSVVHGANLVRVTSVKSVPGDLNLKVTSDDHSVKISPLLLNPDDSFEIQTITTGKPPNFTAHIRVAGISRADLVSTYDAPAQKRTGYLYIALSTTSCVLYFLIAYATVFSQSRRVPMFVALLTMLVLAMVSPIVMRRAFDVLGFDHSRLIERSLSVGLGAVIFIFLVVRKTLRSDSR